MNYWKIATVVLIVLVSYFSLETFANKYLPEEYECSKVCKAQGYTYSGINKEYNLCLCKDKEENIFLSQYFRMSGDKNG